MIDRLRRPCSILNILLIFLISLRSAPVPASPETTNFDALLSLMARALDPVVDSLEPCKDSGDIVISPKGDHKANWFVESSLLKQLTEKGFSVVPSNSTVDGCRYMLSYKILELGVSYLGNHGLWDSSEIRRLSKVNISFELHDLNSGEVVWVKEVNDQLLDSFGKEKLELVESSAYGFTSSKLEGGNILGRILEPIVVSAVVGWVIYLFYTTKPK